MNRPALRQHWAWVVTLVVLLGLYRGTDAALVDTGHDVVPDRRAYRVRRNTHDRTSALIPAKRHRLTLVQ